MVLRLLSKRSRNCLPFPSDAWNVIFHWLMMSLLSNFLQKSQDILHGYEGVTVKDLESLSVSWWNLYLSLLGHSQNLIEFASLAMKNFHNSLRMATAWIWKGEESLLKIFLAAWIELVTMMILEMLSREQAWLIPHLIANSSASELVTNEAWWTVLIRGQFAEWMWEMNVAISFLMLVSVITRAVLGIKELLRTISSSSWVQILWISFSFLLTNLKEKRLEKWSIIQWPGENSGSKGENEGMIPLDLILESMRWPLVKDLWQFVSDPMLKEFVELGCGGLSSMSCFRIWLSSSLRGQIWDLLAIFWRWNLIGMMPAMASIPSAGDALKAPRIQMAALLCNLLRIFMW